MSQEFKREKRYQVIKLKTGRPVDCVVVEADWPEYEIVWKMIEDRMAGKPNRIAELEAQLKSRAEITVNPTPTVSAIMPCGTAVTNVYEAYEAGRKAVLADDWQTVPREPTDVMERAGWDVEELRTPNRIYKAMLAAAPVPPNA